MIAIINYGMGNLRSVSNALRFLGAQPEIVADPAGLREARGIVLPGVGAFGDGMRNLRERGFIEVMEEEVRGRGKPFLGICLGMQLLATTGTEHGEHAGLGWVPGVARLLPTPPDDPSVRVPHIGWNDVQFSGAAALSKGLGPKRTFYFVHSYYLDPEDRTAVTGVCSYGIDFAATLQSGNLHAAQFHPEKSHHAGLGLLRNFLELCGELC